MRGGKYHESSDCFEYPKKSLLKSSYPKNTCQNLPTKNTEIENFKPKKILGSSLSLKIRSTPPPLLPPGAQALFVKSASEIRDFRDICYDEGAVIK